MEREPRLVRAASGERGRRRGPERGAPAPGSVSKLLPPRLQDEKRGTVTTGSASQYSDAGK